MPQGECRGGTAQRRSACTVSGPRIARTEELSFVSIQVLIFPLVKCPYSKINNRVHPTGPYSDMVNADHIPSYS